MIAHARMPVEFSAIKVQEKILVRHFSDVQPDWLEAFRIFLMGAEIQFRPLTEEEIFTEFITPPVFTIAMQLDDLVNMDPGRFELFKYSVLGLIGDALSKKEWGYSKGEGEFNPAMPLAIFLQTNEETQIKLYFRNTKVSPTEMEEGMEKLIPFLKSRTWDGSADSPLSFTIFFSHHNWQFFN